MSSLTLPTNSLIKKPRLHKRKAYIAPRKLFEKGCGVFQRPSSPEHQALIARMGASADPIVSDCPVVHQGDWCEYWPSYPNTFDDQQTP